MSYRKYLLGMSCGLVAVAMAGAASVQTANAQSVSCGLSNGKVATGEAIMVGALVGRTGPDDFSSPSKAAATYFKCVNENGGINGRPIEYLVEDDQWNPEIARQVAVKLVRDKKVVALVGSGSFVDLAVNGKFYVDEGVMTMSGACPVSECFETANSAPLEAGPLAAAVGVAQWAVENLGTKNIVCVTNPIPNSGPYSCNWVVDLMKRKGGEGTIVTIDPASADMNSAVLQLLISEADTVLIHLPVGPASAFLNAVEEQGLRDNYKWVASTPLYDEDVPAALGEYWEDKMFINATFSAFDGKGVDSLNWRAVMDKYAQPDDPRDSFSQGGYLAAKFFVNALLTLDPAKIDRASASDAIRKINETSDLICGTYYVGDAKRHNPVHGLIMMQLIKGGFKQVGECADIDTPYIDDIRITEKAMGIVSK